MSGNQRHDDRIFDDGFIKDVESMSMDDLRGRKGECAELEAELSYARRLLQGKLDIVRHETERRVAGGEAGLEALISNLPQILADDVSSSSLKKHNTVLQPQNSENQRRAVEKLASTGTLAHLEDLSAEELRDLADRLGKAEGQTSERRRRVQDVIDGLNAEMVRRYKEGTEDPSALLSG